MHAIISGWFQMTSNFNLVAANEKIWNSDYSVSVVSRLSEPSMEHAAIQPICRTKNTQHLRLRNLGKDISCLHTPEPNWVCFGRMSVKERVKIIS